MTLKLPTIYSLLLLFLGLPLTTLKAQGVTHYLEQAKIYEEQKLYEQAASNYIKLGSLYFSQSQPDSAAKYYEVGLAVLPPKANVLLEGVTANSLGIIYLRQAYYSAAYKMFERAIVAYEQLGKQRTLADLYLQAGTCAEALHKDEKAEELLLKGVQFAKEHRSQIVLTDSYRILAKLAEKHGETEKLIAYNKLLYSSEQDESATVYQRKLEEKDEDLKQLERQSHETEKQYKERLQNSKNYIYELKRSLEDDRDRLSKQIEALNELKDVQEGVITEQFSQIEEQENVLHAKEEALFYQQVVLGLAVVALIAIGTLSMFLYKGYVKRMKANKLLEEQKRAIELQRNEIEASAFQISKVYNNLQSSLNYAQRIQVAMLPTMEQIQESLPKSFVFLQPKEVVSGDFYWHVQRGSKTFIAAVDCTGHGVPGAFMSMIGHELLNEIVINRGATKPSAILQFLDMGIKQSLHQNTQKRGRDGMDIAICCIDTETQELQYAGAKNPLVYIQGKHLGMIKGDKFSVGNQMPNQRYTNHTIPLSEKPLYCYIYSDGFQDQFGGEENRKFLSKRFRELLFEIHEQNFPHQQKILKEELAKWMGKNHTQVDDILVIGFRITADCEEPSLKIQN